MVSLFILVMIFSLTFPALSQARTEAKKVQCASNLKQLGYAMVMYQSFEGRDTNAFPERLTHLADPQHQYVNDLRLFTCPMDLSHGTGGPLKPGSPADPKADWHEHNGDTAYAGDTRQMYNCSYLYEFSTRTCQTFTPTSDGYGQWDTDDWITQFLVEWIPDPGDGTPTPCNDDALAYDPNGVQVTPAPTHMSRFNLVDASGHGIITWQEAKFWQKQFGDVSCTGLAYPGDVNAFPATWFASTDCDGFQLDPEDMIWSGFDPGDGSLVYSVPQQGYAGAWLPIVRCFWHQTPQFVDNESYEEVLNLAMEGNTFYSAPGWEQTRLEPRGRDGDYVP